MAVSIIMRLLVYHVGSLQEVYTGGPYTARHIWLLVLSCGC